MTTGIQDSNGNPGSLPTKVSPVVADSVEILDSANSNKPAIATLNSLPFVQSSAFPLSLANGGTNHALTADNGGIVYSDATKLDILAHTTTANQALLSGNAVAPSWSTATYPATTTANQLLYSSATNTISGLATANSAVLLTSNAGVPAWSASMTNGQLVIGSTGNTPVIGSLTAGSGVTITSGAGTIQISATGSGGTVTSVSGTPGQITSTGGTTPVIGIDATYVGQTSITTLGTIATGTWAGTNIGLNHGGTNAALTASNGGIFYSTATAGAILAGTATANQMLQSGASGAPAWSTATYPATTTANQILYSSATNVVSGLTTANSGLLVTSAGGVPSIGTAIPNGVTATTQAANDNSTKVATTAYADAIGASSGGLVLIASATASTSATLDLPASMSSTYDNYFCTLENFITPSNSNTLEARFGTGAGPTYVASGYLDNAAATTFISVSGAGNFGNTANSPLGGFFYLTNTQNTTNWKSLHGLTNFTGPASAYAQAICGGTLASATALTSLRLLLASGSITTGTIKIYGIKN